MLPVSRRAFLRAGVGVTAGLALGITEAPLLAQTPALAEKRVRQDDGIEILHPRGRVPLSFFIDDSTCLVNVGHFCLPQFHEVWPDRPEYQKNWKDWPREIPDAFVREFGEWCAAHGVRGKFSMIPYPCCVGWLDRELPGWSQQELRDSRKLIREVMLPNWDLHPEMITHTRVIDIKTGRPFSEIGPGTMENWFPTKKTSADEFAAYIAFALKVLKNAELPAEGITTPGGFGNLLKSELARGVRDAVSDVFAAEIPHYFKYVTSEGKGGVNPRLEHVEGADTDKPKLVVNIPAGTGDWFGGWTGDDEPQGPKYSNDDATAGRMVELIERGDPAIMLCHWPGLYSHGTKKGFEQFKKVALGINGRFGDRTIWMKITEIARYWAAKELTRIEKEGDKVTLTAPFACPSFTLRVTSKGQGPPNITHNGEVMIVKEAMNLTDLRPGTWLRQQDAMTLCADLSKGVTALAV